MNIRSNIIYLQDLDTTIKHTVMLNDLKNCTILITGVTGTIGSYLIDVLLRNNICNNANNTIIAATRDVKKTKELFGLYSLDKLEIVEYNMLETINFDFDVDYIIHVAGNSHPKSFVDTPVDTIWGNVFSTYNLLEYSKTKKIKRFMYISTGEIYGNYNDVVEEYKEDYLGYVDIMSARSCYPISKRLVENLCVSYLHQYGIETVIARPCHTFGPTITDNDSRASAQFFLSAINNNDIVLKSKGEQMRSYNYVSDCCSAILTILINGQAGEAYNVVNPNNKMTIAQLANEIAELANCKVVFDLSDVKEMSYRSPIRRQVLNADKLMSLGWSGAFTLREGISNTLTILKG